MRFIDLVSSSERTIALAPVVGAYLCLSAAGLLRRGELQGFLSDLAEHPASVHAVGAVAFLAGGFILTFQRSWSLPADMVLNLVAALWVFEGAGLLASSRLMRHVFRHPKSAPGVALSTALGGLAGIYLLLVGIAAAVVP